MILIGRVLTEPKAKYNTILLNAIHLLQCIERMLIVLKHYHLLDVQNVYQYMHLLQIESVKLVQRSIVVTVSHDILDIDQIFNETATWPHVYRMVFSSNFQKWWLVVGGVIRLSFQSNSSSQKLSL